MFLSMSTKYVDDKSVSDEFNDIAKTSIGIYENLLFTDNKIIFSYIKSRIDAILLKDEPWYHCVTKNLNVDYTKPND